MAGDTNAGTFLINFGPEFGAGKNLNKISFSLTAAFQLHAAPLRLELRLA